MKIVREKRESKLRKDAWAKWRQSYRSHLSAQHYTERLVIRFYSRWKKQLLEVDHRNAVADEFYRATGEKAMERCWSSWKRALEMRNAEKVVAEKVEVRVMHEALTVWKKQV